MTSWMMKQNPYEYSVKELESAFKLLTRQDGYLYMFNLYRRDVIFVYGKFSFVDCDGRGNLEIYYIDPKRSNNTVHCVVFQQISANRITVLHQKLSDSIMIFGSYDTYIGDKSHDFDFYFKKYDEFDDPINTRDLIARKAAIDLFESHEHITNSLSLINNMIPVDYIAVSKLCGNPFTLDKEKGFGYKLIPSISFTLEKDYIVFSINVIKYKLDSAADAFENIRMFVERTRFKYVDNVWTANTGYIPRSALDTITVSANGITVNGPEGHDGMMLTYNPDLDTNSCKSIDIEKTQLVINVGSSSNSTQIRDVYEEIAREKDTKKPDKVDRVTTHNDSKNRGGSSVKVTKYEPTILDNCPMLAAGVESFYNVTDVKFDDSSRKFNIVTSDGITSTTQTYDFSEYFQLSTNNHRLWIFVNFKEQKVYEIRKMG